ncbi:hypothetical protein DH86_00001728 [Scytalidium sp. 3C]|nr:hypothetical protein DH86_00001728 [Scytalidium sp. 3C]
MHTDKMGFFDALSDLVAAAAPWGTAEAEAPAENEQHHFDECVERVTGADDSEKKGPHEDCVEEFFHLAHCASACAAPKLWRELK